MRRSSLTAPLLEDNDYSTYGTQVSQPRQLSKFNASITPVILPHVLRFLNPLALSETFTLSETFMANEDSTANQEKKPLYPYLLSLRLVSPAFHEVISSREILLPIVASKMLTMQLQFIVSLRDVDDSVLLNTLREKLGLMKLKICIVNHRYEQSNMLLPSLNDVQNLIQSTEFDVRRFREEVFKHLRDDSSAFSNAVNDGYPKGNQLGLSSEKLRQNFTQSVKEIAKGLQSSLNKIKCVALFTIVSMVVYIFLTSPSGISEKNCSKICRMGIAAPCLLSMMLFLLLFTCKFNTAKDDNELGLRLEADIDSFTKNNESCPSVGFFAPPVVRASCTAIKMPQIEDDDAPKAGGGARSH